MILTCPECATSYFVDDSKIAAAGRTVKCSNCGARWTARPEGAEPAPPPPPPKPAPPPQPAPIVAVDEVVFEGPPVVAPAVAERSRPRGAAKAEANGKVAILAVSAGLVVALIAGVIIFRAQIVQMLPASGAAYASLGLPVSTLVIENVKAEPGFQGGRAALSITGQLRNGADRPAVAPPLRISLLDRAGVAVAVKVARPIDSAVPGKAVRYFAVSMVDPPATSRDLVVAFERAGGKAAKAAIAPAPAPPSGPQPVEARPLPPGSPDALPPAPR